MLNAIFAHENRAVALVDALENKLVRRSDISEIRQEQLVNNRELSSQNEHERCSKFPATQTELQTRVARYQAALKGARDVKRDKSYSQKLHQLSQIKGRGA